MIKLTEFEELPEDAHAALRTLKRWYGSGQLGEVFPGLRTMPQTDEEDYEILSQGFEDWLKHTAHLAAVPGLSDHDRAILVIFALAWGSNAIMIMKGPSTFADTAEFAKNLQLSGRDRRKINCIAHWVNALHLGSMHEEVIRNNRQEWGFPLTAAYFMAKGRAEGNVDEAVEAYWQKYLASKDLVGKFALLLPVFAVGFAIFAGWRYGSPVFKFLIDSPQERPITALVCGGFVLLGITAQWLAERLRR